MRRTKVEFIREQGFSVPAVSEASDVLYEALMFQPRMVGSVILLGAVLQNAGLFLALSAALWWSAIVPAANPFDAIYNRFIARPRGLPPLGAAPAPRRFAAGMAGAVALVVGLSLLSGLAMVALMFEGLLGVATMAVVFGRSCAGAATYHRLRQISSAA